MSPISLRRSAASCTDSGTTRDGEAHSSHVHTEIIIDLSAIFGPETLWREAIISRAINSDRDPGEDAIRHIVTEQNILHERVRGASLRCENVIISVLGQLLRVGRIGGVLLDLGDQVLIEENLTNMRRVAIVYACNGAIGKNLGLIDRVGGHC